MRKGTRIRTGNTNEQLIYLLNCNRDCRVTSSAALFFCFNDGNDGCVDRLFCSDSQSHVGRQVHAKQLM
jgi:hypothetical protein